MNDFKCSKHFFLENSFSWDALHLKVHFGGTFKYISKVIEKKTTLRVKAYEITSCTKTSKQLCIYYSWLNLEKACE